MKDNYTRDERKALLEGMQRISDAYYSMSASLGVHPFIEFAGLMNEFIKLCYAAEAAGDETWPFASTHSGRSLPMKSFHVLYLAEKLDCIYGPSLRQDKKLLRMLAQP